MYSIIGSGIPELGNGVKKPSYGKPSYFTEKVIWIFAQSFP